MVDQLRDVVKRRALPVTVERMLDAPVIVLEGPRSVGKSTLLRSIAAAHGVVVLDLDDLAARDAVTVDPGLFVSGPGPVCIDEYQKAPRILDAIKAELNRDGSPGRFVLTGSTRHDALPSAAQALTGRVTRLAILPLSQGELAGVHESLVADLFTDAKARVAAHTGVTTREDYVARVTGGGFPMALRSTSSTARHRWFDAYVALTLERDVRDLSRVRRGPGLAAVLHALAAQTAQVLNVTRIAREVDLDPTTTDSYVHLLEAVFLVQRLPAWGKSLRSRVSGSPKIHIVDPGVAARLLRLTPEKLSARDATALTELGHLLATFVVGELLKQVSWTDGLAGVGHWRTHDGDEVDLVLERDDGCIIAFEVKAGSRMPGEAFAGLRKLREATGDAFVAGVALTLGERAYTFEDRLHVMPVDSIWAGGQG